MSTYERQMEKMIRRLRASESISKSEAPTFHERMDLIKEKLQKESLEQELSRTGSVDVRRRNGHWNGLPL